MKALLVMFTFVASVAGKPVLGTTIQVDLARGLEKAAKGELRDRSLLQRLERGFATSTDPLARLQIANVLTYAPESSGIRNQYVDYVLGQSGAEAALGSREIFRLRRLRAERFFEAGKFDAARRDFEFLMKSEDALVREYAVLKTGWCYMNNEQPHLAWALWIEQVENTIAAHKPVPPNLAHSLGQSLVENQKRTSDDVGRLAGLKFDEAALAQLIQGMEQGADTIQTPSQMRVWVEQSKALAWAPLLATELLEKMGGTGNRACLFLPWVVLLSSDKSVPSLSAQVTESCLVWLNSTKKQSVSAKRSKDNSTELSQSARAVLSEWLPRQPWGAQQLRVPFTYYQWNANMLAACETGLKWISEPGYPEHRARAPIADITETCKQAVADEKAAEKAASLVVSYFQPQSSIKPYLSSAKDPLLFVALALLDQPRFESGILSLLRERARDYESTLLPVLVLERLETQKQYASALQLWESLADKQADDSKQSSVWRQILQRRLKDLKDSKASADATYALLAKTLHSVSDPQLSEFGYGLWLGYLAQEVELARKDPLEVEKRLLSNSRAKSTAEGLLTKARAKAYPKMASASVEMMAWYSLWPVLWDTISSADGVAFAKVRTESLEVRLLAAVVRGDISRNSLSVSDPTLKFIVDLGEKLKSQPTDGEPADSWLGFIKPTGSGVIARDTLFLQSLDQKQKRLLTERKNAKAAAKQALDWIQYLDGQKRNLAKRTWCHELFFHAAQQSLIRFCGQARERIPQLKKAVQGAGSTEAQWEEFFQAFEKKLDACRDTRRASL